MSTSIGAEVRKLQAIHPTKSFKECWKLVAASRPDLENRSVAQNRADAKLAPQKEEEAREEFARIDGIARGLMDRNKTWTYGHALSIVRLCSPKPVKVAAAVPKLLLVQAIECDIITKIKAGLQD